MIVEHVGCCQGFLYWMSYPCVSFLACSFGGLVGSHGCLLARCCYSTSTSLSGDGDLGGAIS